jgi:hypothetical protein
MAVQTSSSSWRRFATRPARELRDESTDFPTILSGRPFDLGRMGNESRFSDCGRIQRIQSNIHGARVTDKPKSTRVTLDLRGRIGNGCLGSYR